MFQQRKYPHFMTKNTGGLDGEVKKIEFSLVLLSCLIHSYRKIWDEEKFRV